mgnify:CR=1 FL=1
MLSPIDIYTRYIRSKEIEHNEYRKSASKGRYSASGAGLCKRKQHYLIRGEDKKEISVPILKRFRLGTIVGKDFDKAMDWYKKQSDCKYKIYSEKAIKLNRLNLHGHFDLLMVDNENNGYLYDYKTAKLGAWQMMFGNKTFNTSFNGSPSEVKDNYEYQIGTYAFMLEEAKELCDSIVHMELIYYKKDDSVIKTKVVPRDYVDLAEMYWTEVLEQKDNEEPPAIELGKIANVPTYSWECKYCDYVKICDSHYKPKG